MSIPPRAGVGLKPEHYEAVLGGQRGSVAHWFEVHAENYMGDGGLPLRALAEIRANHPISVHGVGLSLGGAEDLDPDHLDRLAAVVDRFEPGLVSEHLAWCRHDGTFFNDLLPVAYTEETLARVVAHVDQVQERLGREILVENPSSYLEFRDSRIPEVEFLAELSRRSGCFLLLDVNNIVVSAGNLGFDARAYLDRFPVDRVREIHLAGHASVEDGEGVLLIDAHDRAVPESVWALHDHALARVGPVPTLVEWDQDIPSFEILAGEAARADGMLRARIEERTRAVA